MEVKELRVSGADLSTIEALLQELSQPDPARVVYAIDMLESLASLTGAQLGMLRAMEKSTRQAATDPLTGLANRRTLEDTVRRLGRWVHGLLADRDPVRERLRLVGVDERRHDLDVDPKLEGDVHLRGAAVAKLREPPHGVVRHVEVGRILSGEPERQEAAIGGLQRQSRPTARTCAGRRRASARAPRRSRS